MKKLYLSLTLPAVLLLWVSAASVYASPAVWGRWLSLPGLAFPVLALAVAALALVGAVARTRLAWWPVVGLVACAGSLRDYLPVNLSAPAPKGSLRVITYNTHNFGDEMRDADGQLSVVNFLLSQRPHLAALQETFLHQDSTRQELVRYVRRYGYHYVEAAPGSLGLLTRWPVARTELVYASASNQGAAFYVVPRRADTLLVLNVHLESMHLTIEDRDSYHQLVRNPHEAEHVGGKRRLLHKISVAGVERARQADALARYIDTHRQYKIILLGDFNDTPISYAHHRMCSRLTDAYRATGNGVGRSFNRDAIFVRIDNAFCSEHFRPFAARVMQEVPFSDHYPLEVRFKELDGGSVE